MMTLGLTGGIGTGKSTAERLLRERAVPVVDADAIARQLVEPGRPALAEIRRAFGGEIVGTDGRLRRDMLAQRVFADAEARHKVEAILHPRIREQWLAQAETWRGEGRPLAAVVIPLLFETNAASLFDATLCVACSAATQRRRLLERGLTPEQIKQRINAQWPIERKMALADFVVWTDGQLDVHAQQIGRIVAKL
jgi:dephospho-CoA kinase